MSSAEPLYSAAVDPAFESVVDEPDDSGPRMAVSPVRHRGDAVENAKAARLFG
ncbi:hypothetical protein [Pseudactinotalea terrae]|uniref:hypothetical protein n=1 Tax=Pseudactinotalea terrae TaxID=1743262 RepID=UPI0012E1992E|nr:hypothetical protein [Pseudactinotalea terrae]